MKRPLIALAAMGTLLASMPAMAGEIHVAYGDLDLASVEGQETLERRIDGAAREVCGYNDYTGGSRLPNAAMRRCFSQAKAGAGEQMAMAVNEERLGG